MLHPGLSATPSLWPWLVPIVLGARLIYRRLQAPPPGAGLPPDPLAAALLTSTALAHWAEVPSHWTEGWPLGLFPPPPSLPARR